MNGFFPLPQWPLSLFLSVTNLSNIWYFSSYSYDMLRLKTSKKFFTSFFVTSISEIFFKNIWHWLNNTIFHVKTILTGDVNLDQPDLNSTVRVQIFIGRYFSQIYSAIGAEETQITRNLISQFLFIFSMFYLKIVNFFFQSWLFSRSGLDCENKIQENLWP